MIAAIERPDFAFRAAPSVLVVAAIAAAGDSCSTAGAAGIRACRSFSPPTLDSKPTFSDSTSFAAISALLFGCPAFLVAACSARFAQTNSPVSI